MSSSIIITLMIGILLVGFVLLAVETYLEKDDYLNYAIPIATALICIIFSAFNKKSETLNEGLLWGGSFLILHSLTTHWHRISDENKVLTLGSSLALAAGISYYKFPTWM